MLRGTGPAPRGDPGEILVHELDRLRRVEVADDRDRGVGRNIERAVEFADVFDRRASRSFMLPIVGCLWDAW